MPWKRLWNRKYALMSYIRGSLWIVPFFAMLLNWVFNHITNAVGRWLITTGRIDETTAFYGVSITGAQSLLGNSVSASLSFLVFTFASLLVAIQVAGGQYTPRIIATTLLRDNTIRFVVGYLVFSWLFAASLAMRMGSETVEQFNTFIAAVLGLLSVVVFLYLIDYAARLLRPVSIVQRVGKSGIAVIESVYPRPTTGAQPIASPGRRASPDRTVVHAGRSGIVLAADLTGLAQQARRAKGMIEFVPQVGDFLAVDEPLFRLYGGASAIDDDALRSAVALGPERTMEQDPTFAFRILVDIAIKALSAAINDPTTAVVAIDQLHRLLRLVGLRDLHNDEIRDDTGEVRLVIRTPNWEDFVHLACTEIRHCGAGSVQVMRRMNSMLENLIQTLPSHRHAELRQQLELFSRAAEQSYTFPEDLALARIPDPQGLGGSLGVQPASEG